MLDIVSRLIAPFSPAFDGFFTIKNTNPPFGRSLFGIFKVPFIR